MTYTDSLSAIVTFVVAILVVISIGWYVLETVSVKSNCCFEKLNGTLLDNDGCHVNNIIYNIDDMEKMEICKVKIK